MMHAEQKDCTLKVTSANQTGFLYIRQGELLDAEFGKLSGEVAALELVVWENVEIEMEGTCRCNQRVINCSMAHILLNAFQRKDELLDQTRLAQQNFPEKLITTLARPSSVERQKHNGDKVDPEIDQKGLTSDEITRQQLQKFLQENAEITEYVIFDQQRFPRTKSPGQCTIIAFDPDIFTHLIEQFNSLLNLGPCNFLSFNTSSHSQCLFFHCRQHMVLLKLQSGSEPQLVVKAVKRHANS